MYTSKIILPLLFVGSAIAAACPFAQLRDLGILSPEDAAAYEAVKRDPAHAEAIIKAREEQKREVEERDLLDGLNDVLGDLEKLTLGGGLGTFDLT